DIAKGYFAVWLAGRLTDRDPFWMSAAALAVMAGHAWPVFLRFQGGKAVASFVGAFLCLAPAAIALEAIIFVGIVAWTRHISMGSIVAAATLPLAIWLMDKAPIPCVAAVLGGILIIYKHRRNIERLRLGSEHVFHFEARKR